MSCTPLHIHFSWLQFGGSTETPLRESCLNPFPIWSKNLRTDFSLEGGVCYQANVVTHLLVTLPLHTSFSPLWIDTRCHDFSALADWSPKLTMSCTLLHIHFSWLHLYIVIIPIYKVIPCCVFREGIALNLRIILIYKDNPYVRFPHANFGERRMPCTAINTTQPRKGWQPRLCTLLRRVSSLASDPDWHNEMCQVCVKRYVPTGFPVEPTPVYSDSSSADSTGTIIKHYGWATEV